MYKKKLGVRVITAITVGALLSSNMSVAMANTQIASLEDNLDEEIADEEESVEEEETEAADEAVNEAETEEAEEEESTEEVEETEEEEPAEKSDSEGETAEEEESTVETDEETDAEVETPAEKIEEETAEEETPADEETDAEKETPADEKTDAEEETPADEKTDAEEEAPAEEEMVEEEPAEAVKPVAKAPAHVAKAPKVGEFTVGVIINDGIKDVDYAMIEVTPDENGEITMTAEEWVKKARLSIPEGWKLEDPDEDFTAKPLDNVITLSIVEGEEQPTEMEIVLNYYDETNGKQLKEETITVPSDTYRINIDRITVPEGYVLAAYNDYVIRDGAVYVGLVEDETPAEMEIVLNYYDETNGKQLKEETITVPSDTYRINIDRITVPEGYVLAAYNDYVIRDGYVYVGLIVEETSEEPSEEIIMNIQFYEDTEDNVIAGGDYFVPAGVQNYSVLDKYAPEGYKIAESGDFFAEEGAALKVRVEKIQPTIINVTFVDAQGNNVGGGDYFVDSDGDGIFNYSELDVPEGYKLVVTGDAFVSDFAGKTTELKVVRDGAAIINAQFVDEDGNVIAGGDYFVDEDGDGIFNYNELAEYVPEGYTMLTLGDAFVAEGTFVINISKDSEEPDPETKTITINYVDENGEIVRTETMEVPVGDNNVNTSKLTVPDGYELVWTGDLAIENGVVKVEVKSTGEPTEPEDPDDPDNPDNPDNPDDPDNPDNPDNPNPGTPGEPDDPNTGDEGNGGSGSGSGSHSSGGSSGGSGGGSGSSTGAHALLSGKWILDDIGWWYQYSDNTYAKAGWYSLVWRGNTDWYYFNEAGYLISGWFEQNGNRYFLHDVHDGTFGRMYTGWNQVEGQWYFFNDNADNGTVGALVEGAQVPAELLNQ